MLTVLTTAGYAAFPNAVGLTYRLGSGLNYNPEPNDTNIRGTQVYSGNVQSVTIASATYYRIRIVLPASAGPFHYGEIGIFLSDKPVELGTMEVSRLHGRRIEPFRPADNL